MSTERWHLFISTYAHHADPEEALTQFPFWQIAAVAQSARLRLTRGTAHADLPVQCLASLSEA